MREIFIFIYVILKNKCELVHYWYLKIGVKKYMNNATNMIKKKNCIVLFLFFFLLILLKTNRK